MSARALSLAAALALLGLVPAGASADPVWQAAGPDDAATVNFHAIAAYSPDATHEVVVAVGQDSVAPAPTIYRRIDGQWERQALPTSVSGCLTGIAVTKDAAWAVGGSGSCTDGDPVALRFPGGGDALAAANTAAKWEPVSPGALTHPLTSVAIDGTSGYVGDTSGDIYAITDGAAGTVGSKVSSTPAPTAVNGIALTADKDYAAGDNALPGSGGRVYELSGSGASPAQFRPDSNGPLPLLDVAATTDTPVAIEDGAYWRPDPSANNLWTRYQPSERFTDAGTHLRGVDVAGTGDGTTAVIAGATNAGGATWLRYGLNSDAQHLTTGNWTKYTGLGTALEDAAVVAPNDVWAAGAEGNVRHFAEPPPPPKQDDSGGGGDTGGGNTGGESTDTGGGTPSTGDQTPHVVVVEQPAPKGETSPTKTGEAPKNTQPKPATGRLMRDVRVRVRRGVLIITFRLTAPARVGAKASTAGRMVGLARVRLLGRGKRSLVLRYRGKRPPAQLQLFVRPAAKAATTNRTTK